MNTWHPAFIESSAYYTVKMNQKVFVKYKINTKTYLATL